MTPEQPLRDDPITLDDLRHKALRLRTDVKDEVDRQVESRRNQFIVAGIVLVAVGFGVAYFIGSRAGRAAAEPPPPTLY